MINPYLNKGMSTPVAITIVLLLAVLVGGFTWWQYGEIRKEETKLPEIGLPEKEFCGGSLDSCDGRKMVLEGEIAEYTVWQHIGAEIPSDIENYEEYEYYEHFDLDREYMQIILRSKEEIDCKNKLRVYGLLKVVKIECNPPEIVGKCPGRDYHLFVSKWECEDETAERADFQ